MINFYEITLRPEKVIGCSGVKEYSTGPALGDFVLGFDIYCEGNTIPFYVYRGYPIGFPQGDDYNDIVSQRRKEFLQLIEMSTAQ